MSIDDATIGVVIVDDHLMFAESLARLLRDEDDITVLGIASDGATAADLAARLHPRVALIDYMMPGQDGIAITSAIKAIDAQIMVVMLSGAADDRVLLAAIDAGCSGFLTKDRAATEVAEAVRLAAGGESLISPALLARLLAKMNRGSPTRGADLTGREREILIQLSRGMTNKAIASELFLSVHTVRNYVQSIITKLGAHSKLEAVSTAVREQIIDYPTDA